MSMTTKSISIKSILLSIEDLSKNPRIYMKALDNLAMFLKEFKRGKSPTVYLPLVNSLGDVMNYLVPVISGSANAEEVYAKLTGLLNEITNLDFEYITPRHMETAEKCKKLIMREYKELIEHDDYLRNLLTNDCLRSLLTFNKETLFHIARIIRETGVVVSSLDAIRMVWRRCYAMLRPCKIHDKVRSIAQMYDGLLLIYGVVYNPMPKAVCECTALGPTPFTRAFMNVLLKAVTPKNYIDALRDFIECVVTVHPEPIENAVQYCQETLNKWRAIGIENRNIDSVIYTLYSLIDKLNTQA